MKIQIFPKSALVAVFACAAVTASPGCQGGGNPGNSETDTAADVADDDGPDAIGPDVKDDVFTDAPTDVQPTDSTGETSDADDPGNVDSDMPEDSTGDTSVDTWETPVDTGVCGQEPYEWINPATLGNIVMAEPVVVYTMTKEVIQGLVDDLNYSGNVTIRYGAKVFLFRYTTQDHGKVIEATSLMGFPDVPAEEMPFSAPTVLWLHGTTGFSSVCANSLFSEDGGLTSLLMASQGYVSVSPDYLGMVGMGEQPPIHHPYLVGESTAIASWDALRAGLKLLQEQTQDVVPDGRVLLWGGSQGGHAVFFVDRYAPYYAREFNLIGGLALIPATDLIGQTREALTTFSRATPSLAAFYTAAARWYGIGDRLTEILTEPVAAKLPDLMDDSCDFSNAAIGVASVADVAAAGFVSGVLENDWAGYETWKCLAAENSIGTTSVQRLNDTPLLMLVAEKDSLINPSVERPSYDSLCESGYDMNYLECLDADHTDAPGWSIDTQFEWARARFAGEPVTGTCVRTAAECCINTPAEVCVP